MKIFAKITAIVLALIVLTIVALVIFLKTYDWNRARPLANEKVSAAIGRNFVIGGDLSVRWTRPASESGPRSWIPWPTFTARDVRIDNPEWASRKQFATADAIEFEVQILALLAREIIVSRIALTNPVVDLERNLQAQNTWTFKRKEDSASGWDLQLNALSFGDGVVYVNDQPTRVDMRATIATIGKPIALGDVIARQQAGNAAAAGGRDADASAAGAGTSARAIQSGEAKGSKETKATDATKTTAASAATPAAKAAEKSAAPTEPAASASPAKSDTASDQRYGFDVTMAGTYRDAKLSGSGKIGGALSLIDRQRPFPLEADVRLGDNRMTIAGTLTNPAKLAAVDLKLTLAANSMADLYELTGITLPETPRFETSGHLTGTVDGKAKKLTYENFTGKVGRSDLRGTLTYDSTGPRPRLTGKVDSKRLALADLGPAIGGSNTARPAAKKGAKVAVKDANKALPVKAFRTDRWRAMDADVRFAGASIIRSEALPLSDMSTHIIMKDGVLSLDPLKFGVAGGSVTGTVRLDGRREPLAGSIDVTARKLQLKRLFPAFQPMDTSFGEINGNAKLSGKGNSSSALAASSNGQVKMLINDGAISNALLEQAGLNVANIVIAKLFGDKVVRINCAAADFVVKDGLLDSRVFALDTADALITVEGTINLANEQMKLNVYPQTKGFRIFSLRSPLYVRGTFKNPDVGVMAGPLALRGAAALALGAVNPLAALLALLVPSNDEASPCPAMLATARQGIKAVPASR